MEMLALIHARWNPILFSWSLVRLSSINHSRTRKSRTRTRDQPVSIVQSVRSSFHHRNQDGNNFTIITVIIDIHYNIDLKLGLWHWSSYPSLEPETFWFGVQCSAINISYFSPSFSSLVAAVDTLSRTGLPPSTSRGPADSNLILCCFEHLARPQARRVDPPSCNGLVSK